MSLEQIGSDIIGNIKPGLFSYTNVEQYFELKTGKKWLKNGDNEKDYHDLLLHIKYFLLTYPLHPSDYLKFNPYLTEENRNDRIEKTVKMLTHYIDDVWKKRNTNDIIIKNINDNTIKITKEIHSGNLIIQYCAVGINDVKDGIECVRQTTEEHLERSKHI